MDAKLCPVKEGRTPQFLLDFYLNDAASSASTSSATFPQNNSSQFIIIGGTGFPQSWSGAVNNLTVSSATIQQAASGTTVTLQQFLLSSPSSSIPLGVLQFNLFGSGGFTFDIIQHSSTQTQTCETLTINTTDSKTFPPTSYSFSFTSVAFPPNPQPLSFSFPGVKQTPSPLVYGCYVNQWVTTSSLSGGGQNNIAVTASSSLAVLTLTGFSELSQLYVYGIQPLLFYQLFFTSSSVLLALSLIVGTYIPNNPNNFSIQTTSTFHNTSATSFFVACYNDASSTWKEGVFIVSYTTSQTFSPYYSYINNTTSGQLNINVNSSSPIVFGTFEKNFTLFITNTTSSTLPQTTIEIPNEQSLVITNIATQQTVSYFYNGTNWIEGIFIVSYTTSQTFSSYYSYTYNTSGQVNININSSSPIVFGTFEKNFTLFITNTTSSTLPQTTIEIPNEQSLVITNIATQQTVSYFYNGTNWIEGVYINAQDGFQNTFFTFVSNTTFYYGILTLVQSYQSLQNSFSIEILSSSSLSINPYNFFFVNGLQNTLTTLTLNVSINDYNAFQYRSSLESNSFVAFQASSTTSENYGIVLDGCENTSWQVSELGVSYTVSNISWGQNLSDGNIVWGQFLFYDTSLYFPSGDFTFSLIWNTASTFPDGFNNNPNFCFSIGIAQPGSSITTVRTSQIILYDGTAQKILYTLPSPVVFSSSIVTYVPYFDRTPAIFILANFSLVQTLYSSQSDIPVYSIPDDSSMGQVTSNTLSYTYGIGNNGSIIGGPNEFVVYYIGIQELPSVTTQPFDITLSNTSSLYFFLLNINNYSQTQIFTAFSVDVSKYITFNNDVWQ